MKLGKINLGGRLSELSNIVVIIGPNNSGKTKLLENLYDELVNSYERPDYVRSYTGDPHWKELTDAGFFTFIREEVEDWLTNHENWKMPTQQPNDGAMLMRSSKHILQRRFGELGALTQQKIDSIRNNSGNFQNWQVLFKQAHIEYASIDNRFNGPNELHNIDASNDDNANLLYAKKRTINDINKHIKALFSKILVLLKTSKTQYSLILVDQGQADLPQWANSNDYESDKKTIEEHNAFQQKYVNGILGSQSHGTRAALSLLMVLADETRKIVFLDEPESHIYPAARKYLAKQVAVNSDNRQFFIVTHDVSVLEGIAQSSKDFTLIKLNGKREAKLVEFNSTERRRTSSELKNSRALSAGFSDIAIFVEGIADRYIYQSVLHSQRLIDDDTEYDVIDCGGNDRIADSVKFALDIGTSVAVITDFDTLLDKKKINGQKIGYIDRILSPLNADRQITSLVEQVRTIMGMDTKGVRTSARKGLKAEGLSQADTNTINDLLVRLKGIGVFVVPNGELFDWFSANKNNFAVEDLSAKYLENPVDYKDLTKFMEEVATYAAPN